MKILNTTILATLATLFFGAPAVSRPLPFDEDDEKEEAAEEADEEEEEEEELWFAAIGGDVYTGTGSVLRGATVVSKDGVIEEIGYDVYVPEDAETLDVTGLRVYPGLVAIASSSLFGGTSDLQDSVDPYNRNMTLALAGGITSAVQSNQAAKLKRGDIEGVVMSPKIFASMSFRTSDPKGKGDLRKKFAGAAEYRRKYAEWQQAVKKDKELKEPSKKGVDANALAVLRGDTLAHFRSDGREDLLGIARLAQQFGFRPVIEGCLEGWTIADELGRAGAYAIVTPRSRRSKTERLARDGGSSIENAAILHRAGVQLAIVPASKGISLGGIVGRDLMHLPIEAGFAVRGGLSEAAALDGITIVPARMMGVDHRVGSLEVGKDCDLIVTDGDVLHYQTFVQWAVVDGKVVYDKEDELFFAHIRPRPESSVAPEKKLDAGETEEEEPAAPEEDGDAEEEEEESDDEEAEEAEEEAEEEG